MVPPPHTRRYLIIIAALLLVSAVFGELVPLNGAPRSQAVPYSEFIGAVERGEIRSVKMQGQDIEAVRSDGSKATTYAPESADTFTLLNKNKVEVTVVPPPRPSFLASLLWALLPMVLIIGVWIWMSRNAMKNMTGSGGPFSFGKSRAKLVAPESAVVTFADVAGIEEAKDDLQEIVDFLRDPQKFQRLGGRIPRGVLLVGPPGTGKTLTAKAVAGEAGVPFFQISGSDFVEMFVGVGASRVRDMFEQAKKNSPCIIFIDEIDAVGRHRGAGLGGGNDEREQTLNQLLVEMDGFEANQGVIIIAATNRPDVLDPALLRPGRFDRQIVVPNPDVNGREAILKVHTRKVPLGPDVDLRTVARGTPGFSGADLANIVNEAALLAARRGKRIVMMSEFEDAKDKVMMGAERRTMAMSEDEKKLTAYHEAGHAIVALVVPATDPVHKVTIIPRGRALGMVLQLPERDQLSMSFQQMTSRMAVLMGGRIAEELVFGKERITSGAQSDIDQATRLARAMVTRWGFSKELGTVAYGSNQDEVFLGMSVSRQQNVSEATASKIDTEVRRIIVEGVEVARRILTEKRDDLEALAQGLLEYETMSGEEVKALLAGRPPVRTPEEPGSTRPPRSAVPGAGAPDTQPRNRPSSPQLGGAT
jgi:cell division protease FtsH